MRREFVFLLVGLFATLAFSPNLTAQIVITEIMYHPAQFGDAEFLEIFNNSDSHISLDNWCIEGLSFCFDPGKTIGSGEYLVFAFDRQKFSDVMGFEPDYQYSGRLDNGGEWIRILDFGGNVIDEVRYDDEADWPITPDGTGPSLEVVDPNEDNSTPRNWRASTKFRRHTAGAVNSVDSEGLPPWITSGVSHPSNVVPGSEITVTAPILDADTVQLSYRIDFDQETTIVMSDDGNGADLVEGDGVFTTVIPGQTAGSLVRYRIRAESITGEMSYPRSDDTITYTGTVVGDVSTQLPLFQWFIDEDSFDKVLEHRLTDETEPAVFYYNGKLYDRVQIRVRGGSARRWPKVHWKFIFPIGHPFEAPDFLESSVDRFNLQSSYGDKTFLREVLSYESFADAGVPSCISFPVRLQRNGEFFGLYVFLEQPDEGWLKRMGLPENGVLYKAFGQAVLPDSASDLPDDYEKKTREEESYQDLFEFLTGINQLTGADLRDFLFDNLDVPEIINYLAVQTIIHNNDHVAKNYYLFRDRDCTGRWKMLPWDMDLTFGRNYLGEPTADRGLVLNDTIWADVDFIQERPSVSPSHPLFGDSRHQKWDYLWNRIIDAVFKTPELKEIYFRRLRSLADFQLSTKRFDNRLDELSPVIRPEAQMDSLVWPQYGEYQSQEQAVQYLKNDYLIPRRTHILQTHRIAGEIPTAQSNNVKIVFNELLINPHSENGTEFVELFNLSWLESVDLSDWSIEGIKLKIPPGTVILPRGYVVFVQNDNVFRENYGGGIYLGGEFTGKLKDSGEQLTLLDTLDQVIDKVHYLDSAEWPQPEAGVSLERIEPGLDSDLPNNWSLNASSSGTPGERNSNTIIAEFRSYIPIWRNRDQSYLGLAVSNPFETESTIRFSAITDEGDLFNTGTNPSLYVLNPRNQLARLGSEVFDGTPTLNDSLYVVLDSYPNRPGSFFMFGNSRQLDGALSLAPQSNQVFFTHAENRLQKKAMVTVLGIVNPNDEDVVLILDLIDQSGLVVDSAQRSVMAGGSLNEDLASLFTNSDSLDLGYVKVKTENDMTILGTQTIDLDGGESLIVLNAAVSNTQLEAFSAQLAAGPGVFTQVNLINTANAIRKVSLSVLAENGDSIGTPVDIEMTPGEQLIQNALELFSLPSGSLSVGSLLVSADGNGIVGDVVFGKPNDLKFTAALPLQTRKSAVMVFSQVADTDEFYTGLAFFNPNAESTSITVKVYSSAGVLTGSTNFILGSRKRISRFLRELIPSTADQVGGFVVMESILPIVGQELFGSQNSTFLSAVPPHVE